MNRITALALIGALSVPLTGALATQASADPVTPAPVADTMSKKPMMSDADKRAKAAGCSKEADAKGLHGSAREKFRAACKRK